MQEIAPLSKEGAVDMYIHVSVTLCLFLESQMGDSRWAENARGLFPRERRALIMVSAVQGGSCRIFARVFGDEIGARHL